MARQSAGTRSTGGINREKLLTDLEQRVDHIGQSMAARSGPAPLGKAKKGTPAPRSLKYSEGRLAALLEAKHAIDGASTKSALKKSINASLKKWKEQLGDHRARFGGKNAWIDYDEGALEELERLRGLVR